MLGPYPPTTPDGEKSAAAAKVMLHVRLACLPEPGDRRATERACHQCGRMHWQWRGRRMRYCPECAEARMVGTLSAAERRQGPEWERSVLAALEWWTAEAERLGLLPGDHGTE